MLKSTANDVVALDATTATGISLDTLLKSFITEGTFFNYEEQKLRVTSVTAQSDDKGEYKIVNTNGYGPFMLTCLEQAIAQGIFSIENIPYTFLNPHQIGFRIRPTLQDGTSNPHYSKLVKGREIVVNIWSQRAVDKDGNKLSISPERAEQLALYNSTEGIEAVDTWIYPQVAVKQVLSSDPLAGISKLKALAERLKSGEGSGVALSSEDPF